MKMEKQEVKTVTDGARFTVYKAENENEDSKTPANRPNESQLNRGRNWLFEFLSSKMKSASVSKFSCKRAIGKKLAEENISSCWRCELHIINWSKKIWQYALIKEIQWKKHIG